MKLSEGFEFADNRNLPEVNILMLLEYMLESNRYNAAEIRIAKELLRTKDIYIDTAIGYVELKREDNICTVKCRLESEHVVEKKLYIVSAVIDESSDTIVKIECQECEGCRHAIFFALWLIRHLYDDPENSVSYWTKPIFAEADKVKFVKAKDLIYSEEERDSDDAESMETEPLPERDNSVLEAFLQECKRRNVKSALTKYFSEDSESD